MTALSDLLADRATLASAIAERRRRAFTPPPQVTADEWADEFRIVPSETSAVTGRWDTSTYEVARGPMRAITEPGVRIITGVASAQIFKTSTCETAIGYFMHLSPRPILVYEPTDTTVAAFVDSKLDPMIRATPELAALWGGRKALEKKRDDFTAQKKIFAGGYIEILTANSPANTASRSAGVVIMDEVDKFELTRDGDPVALIDERLKGYTGEELSIRMSTPTLEGDSPIAAEYAKSDQRKPYLECPHCGEWHFLKWSRVSYKDADGRADPERAEYFCESCGCGWTEAERIKRLTTKGSVSWRQTRPFTCCEERQDPNVERVWFERHGVLRAACKHCGRIAVSNRHAGFWAWEAYNPRVPLENLVRAWLDCQGNPGKLQNFVNSKLAETWKPADEQDSTADPEQFAARVEPSWDAIPAAVRVLTLGVDVQPAGEHGGLFFELVGWGDGEENWSLDYGHLAGDPNDGDVWAELDDLRRRGYQTDDGRTLHVQATAVDTGGHNTDAVMSYCGARQRERVFAIKGGSERPGPRAPIWPTAAPQTIRHGAKLYVIGTQAAKDFTAACVRKTQAGPGFMHVPASRNASWFQEMLNERLKFTKVNGRTVSAWSPRASGVRTEALDCRVYAKAALEGLKRAGFRLVASAPATATRTVPENPEPKSEIPEKPAPRPVKKIRRAPVARKSSLWG